MSQFRIDRIAGTGCSTPSDARTGPIRQPVSAAGTYPAASPEQPSAANAACHKKIRAVPHGLHGSSYSCYGLFYIGVFLTFFFSAMKFNQGGLASFVLLSGITVNAAIYILYDYNIRLRNNNTDDSALNLYIMSFKQKIKTVLLTVISSVVGFLPVALSVSKESFWFALALRTIGGLIMSLFTILPLIPRPVV